MRSISWIFFIRHWVFFLRDNRRGISHKPQCKHRALCHVHEFFLKRHLKMDFFLFPNLIQDHKKMWKPHLTWSNWISVSSFSASLTVRIICREHSLFRLLNLPSIHFFTFFTQQIMLFIKVDIRWCAGYKIFIVELTTKRGHGQQSLSQMSRQSK